MSTIYEFSTGINIQRESNDRWWSVGFRGGWMLNTYGQDGIYEPLGNGGAYNIPYAIQQAYDNKEFSVGETNRSQFTVAGRIIKLNNEEWSVVAFLTYASDEKGRRVPTYRFFFSEGNSILDILRRIVTFEATSSNRLPVFHPSKITDLNRYEPADLSEINSKIVRNSNLEEDIKQSSGIRTHVLRENACLVDKSHALSLFNLNRLTLQRAAIINETGNQSWAYNADVLQRTETFILIQAADESAYRSLNNKRSGGIVKYQAGVDEQAIKDALKGLIEYENIDKTAGDNLKTIATAIQDPKVNEVYIRDIARALGLTDYSLFTQTYPQLVKLHIVLSLFFPKVEEQVTQWKRLADLGWEEVIDTFTEKIKGYISQYKLANVLKSANDKIKKFYNENTDPDAFNVREDVVWLLKESLWANDVILDFFEQNVGLRLKIRTAFKELTENENIDQTALDNLMVIANAIRTLQIDERYIKGIASSLGLTDTALYSTPTHPVVKLYILINLFFLNIEEHQVKQVRRLTAIQNLKQVIFTYTKKIQGYLITSNISYVLQNASNSAIIYCLKYIRDNFRQEEMVNLDISSKISDNINWLLNSSIWSYEPTKNNFDNEINKDQNFQILCVYNKHILIPSLIRDALEQLIKDDVNIDKNAPNNLIDIAQAITQDRQVRDYIPKVAQSLGLIRNVLNNSSVNPESIKLYVLLSFFIPDVKAQFEQRQKFTNTSREFTDLYITKIKQYADSVNLYTTYLRDIDNEVIRFCFSHITSNFASKDIVKPCMSFDIENNLEWLLTESIWSSQSTETVFYEKLNQPINSSVAALWEKHIYQPKQIRLALKELINDTNINQNIFIEKLKIINNAIQVNQISQLYIEDVAEILELRLEALGKPNPKRELIRFHIILSLFFPDVKKQLKQWRKLADNGMDDLIFSYIEKIKGYLKGSDLLKDQEDKIIQYCFTEIQSSFSSQKKEPNRPKHIVWVLTKSLWANASTLNLFKNTIYSFLEYAFTVNEELGDQNG
jgi:hypothetical protein